MQKREKTRGNERKQEKIEEKHNVNAVAQAPIKNYYMFC